jgi:hypothetical protein
VKPCPYNEPSIIALYFEGRLEAEVDEEFSRHLLTCPRCLKALAELERDMSLMHGMKLEELPRAISRRAVFRLEPQGLHVLRNLLGSRGFSPYLQPAFRGAPARTAQRYQEEDVRIDIIPGSEEEFSMRIDGVRGRSLTLMEGERVVERRSGSEEDSLRVDGLARGGFSLLIDEEGFLSFIVC